MATTAKERAALAAVIAEFKSRFLRQRDEVAKGRKALVADGTIADGRLTRAFAFSSPSAAACVVPGRSSNGPKEWKTADGRALGEVARGA